jgi:CSLREA domain-containing protein
MMFDKTRTSRIYSMLLNMTLVLSVLLGSALIVTPVYAAEITINTSNDELNNDGDCSLREAIQAANTNSQVDACGPGSGADTITIPAGTYTLTIAGTGEDANATGDLDITDSLTINGAGAGTTIIRAHATTGSGIDRVFDVIGAISVTISDVTLANGRCTSCNGGGIRNTAP